MDPVQAAAFLQAVCLGDGELVGLQSLLELGAAPLAAGSLAAGSPGKRHALPNSRIMIHQPWGGVGGTALDISIQADEILRLKDTLNGILSKHSGKPVEEVAKDSDRDFFMGAAEAKEYGLIDEILEKPPKG